MCELSDILSNLIVSPTIVDLRKHLTCGPCVLLAWAVSNRRNDSTSSAAFKKTHDLLTEELQVLEPYLCLAPYVPDSKQITTLLDGYPQLKARLDLITAILKVGDLKTAIENLVTATGDAWGHTTLSYVKSIESTVGQPVPIANSRLEPSFMPFLGSPRLADTFRTVASSVGWSHPGLLMAGEILAALSGDVRKADVTVRTKIMFAADHPTNPQGVLADITVERLPNGCGLLIPDATRCGYLSMERGFSNGLQNALWAARDYACRSFSDHIHQFDWRWSIDLMPVMKKMPKDCTQVKLSGRSAEVAVACALIAAHGSNPDNVGGIDPLDPHVGATASLRNPGNPDTDLVQGVTSIDVKTLVGSMDTKRLLQVIVASDQDPRWIPNDPRFEFPEAATLKAAYQLMTRFPRMTRGVNRYLKKKATQLADDRCTPYVLPEIEEVIPSRDLHTSRGNEERLRSLTEQEVLQLMTGQLQRSRDVPIDHQSGQDPAATWSGNRVRLFADSGMGKSVFILHCEAAVAASGQNLLPVRLGRCTGEDGSLAQITWNAGDLSQVINRLADLPSLTQAMDSFAAEHTLPNWEISGEQRKEWFRWMIRHGRVVFLLDALDQVEKAVDGQGLFLGSGDVRKCRVIVTGRPEALRGRPQAWVENSDWKTLRLLPFDETRQRAYLGKTLAEILIPKSEEVDCYTDDDELRRHQWKDLLEVPLLLSLVKQLALSLEESENLRNIQSRYELYNRAVQHLIRKGWQSVEKDEDHKLLQSEIRVREVLGIVAWFMIRQHDFTGTLKGTLFQALAGSKLLDAAGHGAGVLKALQQVDLITAFQVLDELGETGLSFRHRSFMEFFAGCHMMDQIRRVHDETGEIARTDRVSSALRDQTLVEIHATLDSIGNLLPHMRTDRANRPADWHDTLRFALSHAQLEARDRLAVQLIELGNPWVVAEAMKRDGNRFSREVECLSAWLVHGDCPDWFDYRRALRWVHDQPEAAVRPAAEAFVSDNPNAVVKMQHRSHRDAASLAMLRPLLPNAAGLYSDLSAEAKLVDQLTRLPGSGGTWNFLNSFVKIQGGVFDLNAYAEHSEVRPKTQRLSAFRLADFPVTNAAFEVFCPSHRRHRDQYSGQDEQPVIHANWFMAKEFCHWLSALTGKTFRLPSEWEWE